MSKKTVKVWYADGEAGSAEILSGRVARVVDSPLLNLELCRDAIVRLDRSPSGGEIPRIAQVLHSPYPRRSVVRYAVPEEALLLVALFGAVGAKCDLARGPEEGVPGSMFVSHDSHVDPKMLAEAVGVQQPLDGEAEGDPEDGPE